MLSEVCASTKLHILSTPLILHDFYADNSFPDIVIFYE